MSQYTDLKPWQMLGHVVFCGCRKILLVLHQYAVVCVMAALLIESLTLAQEGGQATLV